MTEECRRNETCNGCVEEPECRHDERKEEVVNEILSLGFGLKTDIAMEGYERGHFDGIHKGRELQKKEDIERMSKSVAYSKQELIDKFREQAKLEGRKEALEEVVQIIKKNKDAMQDGSFYWQLLEKLKVMKG
jgi:hypothetical protein